jgi:hypothetical protein
MIIMLICLLGSSIYAGWRHRQPSPKTRPSLTGDV